MTKFKSNPFAGKVKYLKQSEDERDWDSYVKDMREKMNDPNWNPITIVDEDQYVSSGNRQNGRQ